MSSTDASIISNGGSPGPHARRIVRKFTLRQARLARLQARNTRRDLGITNSVSKKVDTVGLVVPKPEEQTRVYTWKDFADRACVEAALADHIARAQKEAPQGLDYRSIFPVNGSIFIGFNGTESRVLSQEELCDFVLADKSVAVQLYNSLAISPIPHSIAINLNSNVAFSDSNALQAPTITECKAAAIEDLKQIVPFSFKKLPAEVRKMIYVTSDVFALRHDKQIPPFYQVALCNNFLKEEAKKAYNQINYLLTLANEPQFNKFTMYDIKSLNHMYFQWSWAGMPEYQNCFLQLRANRCQIVNNLHSLTMDFSGAAEPGNLSLMQNISRASSGVYRLTVRLESMVKLESKHCRSPADIENLASSRLHLIHYANEWIRTPGRLVSVNTADVEEEWFWERDGAQFLDLGPIRKTRRNETSVKGNVTLADRIEGRSILVR
ncbi:hypothetical protein BKA65DRAFT_563091 [Rhexocercosporidium sp. MPI-PUGE-AT-0058]|nr:hypothetical protein BKA65DRAFT_563091 [Rhexocercosporidium sp. MPI-PUGE-AT-0058]